jgi:acetyl esterase/lipase
LVVVVAAVIAITTGAVASAQSAPTRDAIGAGGVVIEQDVAWRTVDGETLTLDAYLPESGGGDRAALLLVHGGGWSGGDQSDFAGEARAFAELGYVAVTIEYRLAPDYQNADAIEDVQAAVTWLRDSTQVGRYGIDPARIGVLGASAGGQLAELLGTLGTGATDVGTRVAAVVAWSGVADLSTVDLEVGVLGCETSECPDVAAAASPITHVDATDPSMLLVTSANDPIVPRAQAEVMEGALGAAGVDHQLVVVGGSGHAQQLRGAAWVETVSFLDQHLRPGGP